MIHKIKYGNIEDVTVVEFGHGTTRVVNSVNEENGHKAILLGDSKIREEIGKIGVKHRTSDEFNPKIAIVFWNEESFAVFEEFVKNVRKEYNKEKINKTKHESTRNN